MRTYQQKTAETKHDWYIVDATGRPRLGQLAVRIAQALSGKKPTWTPPIDDGDHVVVAVQRQRVELSGNKLTQKIYYRHSGYPGGLREQTAREVMDKHPERLIEMAVRGMLATNRTRAVQLGRLKVYRARRTHTAQSPVEAPPSEVVDQDLFGGTGRRKRAIARVRMTLGQGVAGDQQ